MDAINNFFVRVSFESGIYDHAITMHWKQGISAATYIHEMNQVKRLFLEHPSFSILVLDFTNVPQLDAETIRWTAKSFLRSIGVQINQVVIHHHQNTSPAFIVQLKEALENEGQLVRLVNEHQALQDMLSAL